MLEPYCWPTVQKFAVASSVLKLSKFHLGVHLASATARQLKSGAALSSKVKMNSVVVIHDGPSAGQTVFLSSDPEKKWLKMRLSLSWRSELPQCSSTMCSPESQRSGVTSYHAFATRIFCQFFFSATSIFANQKKLWRCMLIMVLMVTWYNAGKNSLPSSQAFILKITNNNKSF